MEPFQNQGRACPRPNLTSSPLPARSAQASHPQSGTALVRGQAQPPHPSTRHQSPSTLRPRQPQPVAFALPAGQNAGSQDTAVRIPQQHLVRGALRPQLQHYDSIQELYSFVSNVLSSWESRVGAGDDGSSITSGAQPQFNGRGGGSIPSGNSSVAGSTISSTASGRRFQEPGSTFQGRGQQQQNESTYYATLSHYNLTGRSRFSHLNPNYPPGTLTPHPRGAFAPVVRHRQLDPASTSSLIGGGRQGGGTDQYYTAAVPAAGSNNTYFYQESVCQGSSQPQEEPISRPVSNLSNKSSEQYYTYPYPRKQQELILRSPDWATVINWARRVVQSREDENVTRTDCSHEFHDVRGLKKHEHTHSWPHVQPQECNVLFLAKVNSEISFFSLYQNGISLRFLSPSIQWKRPET